MKHLPLACLISGLSFAAQAAPAAETQCKARPQANASAQLSRDKVGEEIFQSFESPHPYAKAQATSGATHTDVIHHPGATYIAPHFAKLELEDGDFLIVRSPDGARSWKYDNSHPGARDGFWGIHIPGDTAIVELHDLDQPSRLGLRNRHGYSIDKYARGFAPLELGASDFDTKAVCGADDSGWARCYESDTQIYGHAKAVARLLIGGTSACTGWLVGNQGHLITNNHCISTASEAANTSYEFMAEGATCATSCASWGACAGTIVASSGTLIKTDAPLDYTLIQLPTNPTATYGFLQLRPAGAVVEERIYVPQHPAAYGKKIAVTSSDSRDGSGFAEVYSLNEAACQTGGPNDVGYFADTQGGSSGSPVIGHADHQVVALHHCANCPNRGVPIQSVISSIGSSLPQCALRSTDCPDPYGATGEPPEPPEPNPNTFTFSTTNTNGAQQNTVNKVIALTPGQKINLGTCGVNGGSFSGDTLVRFFGPSGTEVGSNDDACGGRGSNLVFTVPAGAGGNYEVRAGCYSSGACSGTMAWEITDGPAPPAGSSGTFNFSATNTNSAQQNTINQNITAAAGQTVTVATCGVTGASFTGDTYLRLHNAAGTSLATNDDACGGRGSSITYSVTTAGTLQIRAGCYSSGTCSGTVAWSVQ
ncbi:serine protease [Myxococcaceae bacterium GXIMD 01537]